MKRGEILYPHSFTILAAILYHGNDCSIQELCKRLEARGPEAQSFNQILRHLTRKGYVARVDEEKRAYGHRIRWCVTQDGIDIVRKTEEYYRWALTLCARRDQGGWDDEV